MNTGNKKCLFFSRFPLTAQGGGGCRREKQITEELSPLNFQFISAHDYNYKNPNILKKIFIVGNDYTYWTKDFINYVYKLRLFSKKCIKDFSSKINLVIIDDPIFFAPIIKKLKRKNIPIIYTCQNIESLSLSQVKYKKQLKLFKSEIKLLSLSSLIISISREETVLLNNLNLNTYYFPYFPVESIRKRMFEIRKIRKSSKKSDILILGTVNNNATRDGLIEVINFWKNNLYEFPEYKLIIAGFQSEKLRKNINTDRIKFLGTLNNTELDKLLCTIKACLCYQKTGAGALTKIPEMLIANIPVIANSHALRSYYNYDGIIEFTDFNDLCTILKQFPIFNDIVPPKKPTSDKLKYKINEIIYEKRKK